MDTHPYPDPFVRGTDPRIWIRTKMSQFRNSGLIGLDACGILTLASFFKILMEVLSAVFQSKIGLARSS
jgi:hypothetical protein